jgi:hypothetical protein
MDEGTFIIHFKVLKEFAIRPKQEVAQTIERIAKVDTGIAEIVKG